MFKSCVCERVCVYVSLLSVWASELGTERSLTWRQLSWQQRTSSRSARSQLSQNPTDLSLLSSVSGLSWSISPVLYQNTSLTPLSPSPSSLFSTSLSPLLFSTSLSLYLLPHFPAFSNPQSSSSYSPSLLLSSTAVTDINRGHKLQ